jgi:hypothetical protein
VYAKRALPDAEVPKDDTELLLERGWNDTSMEIRPPGFSSVRLIARLFCTHPGKVT